MKQRTYVELVLELFAFISFALAMMATGTAVLIFASMTIVLTAWIPFQQGTCNRLTRAVAIALCIAAVARTVAHFLPDPSI